MGDAAREGGDHGGELEDDFEVEEEPIGRGHYSVVYRGTHRRSGGEYAIKVIDKTSTGAAQLGDVMREVEILKALGRHDCLCGLHHYYDSEKVLNIVLDLAKGPPLFTQIVQRVHYSEKDAALLTRNLVEAIHFMASKRICHRDLKPENILLSEVPCEAGTGHRIKLVDFGFAEFSTLDDPQLTKCCGTPLYIAPEVLNCGLFKTGGPYNLQCDLWSLGVITYILICGYAPFRAKSTNEQFKKIVRGAFTFPPQKVWGQVSDAAKDFITCLLVLDPEQRRTAQQMREHPWISHLGTGDDLAPPDEHLEEMVGNLKEFNAQQKWRKGIFGVEAITRMRYAALCKQLCVRPNSDVERILTEATSAVNVVDLSNNYLGPKGLLALMGILESKPEITALIFGRNGVNNTVVEKLCQIIKRHPGVVRVDLSNNAISHMAGRYLLAAVQTNQRLVEVSLEGTALHESAIRKIEAQLERNRQRAAELAAAPPLP